VHSVHRLERVKLVDIFGRLFALADWDRSGALSVRWAAVVIM
jgi:hypothetical protein